MGSPSIFGHIPGYPVGQPFRSREEVRQAGLHRHLQRGISGDYHQGADAIVLSAGYVDDEDYGSVIIYTGEGGQDRDRKRQVTDQVMQQGNYALVLSEEHALPVRVIRGAQHEAPDPPKSGYRYDGLYTVARHWQETSKDGPLIYRYELRQLAHEATTDWQAARLDTWTEPAGTERPGRNLGVEQRVVRSTRVTHYVKRMYDATCQVCGTRLEINGIGYAEGAHIRPLGSPHNGPDTVNNMLCLCPNHHVLFDKGAIFIRDEAWYQAADGRWLGDVRRDEAHKLNESHIAYHRTTFAGQPT